MKFTRTIGERVEKFERDVARLKEGIGGLWKEWEGVQEEVKKVVEELEKEGLEEVNEAREKEEAWKRRVEEVCEGWVERVKESERVSWDHFFLFLPFDLHVHYILSYHLTLLAFYPHRAIPRTLFARYTWLLICRLC